VRWRTLVHAGGAYAFWLCAREFLGTTEVSIYYLLSNWRGGNPPRPVRDVSPVSQLTPPPPYLITDISGIARPPPYLLECSSIVRSEGVEVNADIGWLHILP